jgi:putative ABC transport system substrate-binding protein
VTISVKKDCQVIPFLFIMFKVSSMKKVFILILLFLSLFPCCERKQKNPSQAKERKLYSIGIFQVNDAPTLNEVRKGVIQALEEAGLRDGVNVNLKIRNAMGDISEVQRIAQEFAEKKMDIIIPLSTPCLQAALIETRNIPIIFSSVANPYLIGAGKTAQEHLSHVTGVASTGPVKQMVTFIHEVLPRVKRLGTLWTPSELNSEFYLELAKERASELGLEIITVPVQNPNEVLLSAQILMNKKIEVICQISDNTINASFETLGRVAEENAIPLFGGFPLSAQFGACAAMGYDFFEMGHKTGQIVLRVKNGESPARIPFQHMEKVNLYLNLQAAEKQGVIFPEKILKSADKILGL